MVVVAIRSPDGLVVGLAPVEAAAEALRLNTTVTSLTLSGNGLGREVLSVLRQAGPPGEGNWGCLPLSPPFPPPPFRPSLYT
jgi:hypothetical protein